MPFSELVGHHKQLAILRRALEKERLHHAYVFLGPERIGKVTVALALAKAIHCSEMAGDFCGRCASCITIESGNHPDVRVVGPLAGKKEISIQQVRELERELSYRAFSARKKIAIIDPASLMSFPAQNALLKTLEEPPRNSVLILVSTSAGGLLSTVLSRCLRLSFAPLAAKEVAERLVAQKGLRREEAEVVSALTMGSLGRALDPEMEELVQRRRVWVEEIGSAADANCRKWIALSESLSQVREESLSFLQWLEGWYRDVMIYLATGSDREVCHLDLKGSIKQQADRCSLERSLFLLSQIIGTAAKIRRNVNRRIALDNLFAHLAGLH
jgi:DNA polymerase-3 subunit delta'